jgi:hypothetical protein
MPALTTIQLRRGTSTQWANSTNALAQGEMGYDLTLKKYKIGDGTSLWSSLQWATVLGGDLVGASGINITYSDVSGTATVSVSGITSSQVTDFNTSVSGLVNGIYAPLNSPTFAGTVSGISKSMVGLGNVDNTSDADKPVSTATQSALDLKASLAGATFTGPVVIPSGTGNFNTLTVNGTAVSVAGHTHTASNITDFNTAVSGLLEVKSLTQGSGIGIVSVSGDHTVSVTGIPTSLITNFASGVNALIDNAVSASIIGGSGVDIVYSSGTNTLTISSALIAGSGISLTQNSGNYTIALSDPTIQLADITDLTSDARTFLVTPSSSNLSALVTDETGSGNLVFSNSPTLVSPTLGAASATSVNKVTITAPATGSTLTVADGKTLTASNTLTFTGTDSSSVAFGAGGTVLYTSNKLSALSSTSSSELAGVISDETGTGPLVFANNPTMSGVTVNGNLTVSGSGLVASNINDFNTAVRTNRLDQMAVPTSDVSFNSVKITSLADPVSAQDAATKAYVDASRMGLDVKASVRVATTENITRSGTQTIDGVVLVAGDRVLVKNQSTGSQNGIYDVAAGSWTRASDADSSAKVTTGMFTFVSEGTVNADSGWVVTTNDEIVLGTTSLAFAQFSGAGQITAGAGLTQNSNTIDAVGTAGRIVVNADSIDLDTVSQSDGSGSAGTSFVQSVTRDSYGRVTGVTTASVQDSTTSAKGIASFDSGDFSVTAGAVSIKASGVDNSQLVNSSVTIGSTSVSLGGSITSVSGLTSVTSTSFSGDLSGTATNANNIEVDLSTANTNNLVFVNGTDGNLKPSVNNNLRFNASGNELLGSSNTTPATTLKYFIIDGGTP